MKITTKERRLILSVLQKRFLALSAPSVRAHVFPEATRREQVELLKIIGKLKKPITRPIKNAFVNDQVRFVKG